MAQEDKDSQEITDEGGATVKASEPAVAPPTAGSEGVSGIPNVDPAASLESSDPSFQSDEEIAPLPDFSGLMSEAVECSIDLLKDVELNVKIELGRSEMSVEEILKLNNGSVVELDKLAGDPVDILVNEQLIAHGEVLVLNDNFCVRVNEIIPGINKQVAQC